MSPKGVLETNISGSYKTRLMIKNGLLCLIEYHFEPFVLIACFVSFSKLGWHDYLVLPYVFNPLSQPQRLVKEKKVS